MRSLLRVVPLFVFGSFLFPTNPVWAQRGQLIEDLFRTIAETQLQRMQADAKRDAHRPTAVPPTKIQPVPVPGSIFPSNSAPSHRPGTLSPVNPSRTSAFPHDRRISLDAIQVGSRDAADFANHLVAFNRGIAPLVHEMRSVAAQNPAIRDLIPEAFQVSADTRALLQQCDGLRSLAPITTPYSELDARWRSLSFRLRSMSGLSHQCTASIRTCDQLVSTISRQLHIHPQFNRHELHDQMIIASTHMVTLMDDLQMSRFNPSEIQQWTHDCRLLRQRLLQEADRVESTTYEDAVTRFTDFTSRWGKFSQTIYALNDPYLQRRLDRIRECGDQTYAILWMPPPYDATSLTASAKRLERATADLLDQMTFRAMASLSSREQIQILEASRRMYHQCGELVRTATRNASRRDLSGRYRQIDADWNILRAACYKTPSLQRATLAAIDHECGRIRNALGVTATGTQSICYEELIQLAAALEGSAQYFDADVERYKRYLQPASYRDSIITGTHEFVHHATELHSKLSVRADFQSLQSEAEHMLDGWAQLSDAVRDVERHGLSANRARSLQQAHADLVPIVAQIAAALLER